MKRMRKRKYGTFTDIYLYTGLGQENVIYEMGVIK